MAKIIFKGKRIDTKKLDKVKKLGKNPNKKAKKGE